MGSEPKNHNFEKTLNIVIFIKGLKFKSVSGVVSDETALLT